MMRGKFLALTAAVVASSSAMAAPFIFPDTWTSNKPNEVKRGGVYRDATLGDFNTLNPFLPHGTPSIVGYLREITGGGSLLRMDPVKKEYIPYMAESYTISADKRVIMAKLRDGMKWSDGKPIVAEDFVTAWKLYTDEGVGSDVGQLFYTNGKLVTTSAPDAKTVVFKLPSPTSDFVDTMAQIFPEPTHVWMPLFKAKGAEGVKAAWTINTPADQIVTAGPFMFESYRVGERVNLKRNPYWGEWNKNSAGQALPYLDGYSVTIAKDQNSWKSLFLGGQVDSAYITSSDDIANINRAGAGLKAVVKPRYAKGGQSTYMAFNFNKASDKVKQDLFRNANFRRAMSHLTNRAAMVDIVFGGLGSPSYSFLAPAWEKTPAYPSDIKKYDYNLDAAKKLLAGLGFSKKGPDGILVNAQGRRLEFDLVTNAGNTAREQMAQIFVKSAAEVGVKVNFRAIDFNSLVSMIQEEGNDRKFDAYMLGISMPYIALPLLSDMACGSHTGSYNGSGTCLVPAETQISNLLAKAQGEFDFAKRMKIVQDVVRIDANEQLRAVQMAALDANTGWNARVQGEYPAGVASPLLDWGRTVRTFALTWIQ